MNEMSQMVAWARNSQGVLIDIIRVIRMCAGSGTGKTESIGMEVSSGKVPRRKTLMNQLSVGMVELCTVE